MSLNLRLGLGVVRGASAAPSAPSARYWRAFFPRETIGGGAAIALAAADWLDGSGSSVTGGGTPTGTWTASNSAFGAVSNLYDGDTGTFWAANSDYNHWVQFDAGSGNTIAPEQFTMQARSASNQNQAPSIVEIRYSDDGATFTTYAIWSIGAGNSWSASEVETIDFGTGPNASSYSAGTAARIWGVYTIQSQITAAMSIARLEFLESSVAISTASGTPLVRTRDFGTDAGLVDANYSTYAGTAGTPEGQFFCFDFGGGSEQTPDQIRIQARDVSGIATDYQQTPNLFRIVYASANRGLYAFSDLITVSPDFASASQQKTFDV